MLFISVKENKDAMSVALFIFEELLCRYLCPEECIVHDRGSEFCNKVVQVLFEKYGMKKIIITVGRPHGNG